MMDSHDTNQPLNQGELEEEKKTVEVSEAVTETPAEETNVDQQPESAPRPMTKEEVLLRIKDLAQDAENANKQELDSLCLPTRKNHSSTAHNLLFPTAIILSGTSYILILRA